MLKVFSLLLVAALIFGAGCLFAIKWKKAERDLATVIDLYGRGSPDNTIDKICIVDTGRSRDAKTNIFAEIVGREEAARTFASCGGDLVRCCPYDTETATAVVIKRGAVLSCDFTWVDLKLNAPPIVCAAPSQLYEILQHVEPRH
jgi:hypothetical protein